MSPAADIIGESVNKMEIQITMQHFYSSLLVLSFLTIGSVAVAKNTPSSNAIETYPPEFVQDYSQECLQTSMGEGLEATEARILCRCTIKEFQNQYTLEEFKQLTAKSATDKTAENTLIEVGQVCFEQILYEQ
jgi:hypothetical protein